MSISSENQDLQTYFDSFNKEIEEDAVSANSLPSEAVETLSEMDVMEQCSIIERTPSDGEQEMRSDMYFIDQEGNYYIQSAEDTVLDSSQATITNVSKIVNVKSSAKLSKKTNSDTNTQGDTDGGAEELSYVVIMDCNDKQIQSIDVNDPDDPDHQEYDFIENGDEIDIIDSKDLMVPENVIKIEPKECEGNYNAESSGDYLHSCLHCSYVTTKRYILARHLKAHSDSRPHKCSVCERGFKTSAALNNHYNTHLGKKPHACKFCDMCFTTSGELVRHNRYRHTGEKPHKCDECDYSSVELSKLRRHMRCHTGERPYQCPHCTYASPDTFKLKRHMRTHTGEKPYECEICHARFTQSNSLKAHRMIHSVGDKPVYQCALCPTTCGRKTDLRLHVQKLHHSDRPIKCKRCGKNLPDRYSYKIHVKSHEGEKCFKCKVCPYASISLRHLETHILIHTDQKPFVCRQCETAFRQRQLLKRHINLYHTKDYVPPTPRDKPHICPHCQRPFTHKGNLMRHMEMHDPDSKLQRQKLQLQIGRMTRVKPNGSLLQVDPHSSDDAENENIEPALEEEYEIIDAIDEEYEPKPMSSMFKVEKDKSAVHKKVNRSTVKIEPESEIEEFLNVKVGDQDEKGYMVLEVVPCEGEEEDDINYITVENTSNQEDIKIIPDAKTDVGCYFGFEEEINETYENEVNDRKKEDSKSLFEIIE